MKSSGVTFYEFLLSSFIIGEKGQFFLYFFYQHSVGKRVLQKIFIFFMENMRKQTYSENFYIYDRKSNVL